MNVTHLPCITPEFCSGRTFLRCLKALTALVLFVLSAGPPARSAGLRDTLLLRKNPNVIFIMADSLRADHVGCYGYSRNTTPNIDSLALGAMRFGRALSQSSHTMWSVPSILGSRYPQRVQPAEWRSVAHMLKDRGYATGAVVSNPLLTRKAESLVLNKRLSEGFDHFSAAGSKEKVSSPAVLEEAKRTLSQLQGEKFFLFLLFMDPHSPYILDEKHDFDPGYDGQFRKSMHVGAADRKSSGKYSEEDIERMKALYDSDMARMDERVGLFLEELRKRGLYDSSLIIFFSDHGEEFADHGGFFHGWTLHEEMLNVPLIVKLPGSRKGTVIKGSFPLIDLVPSVMKYLGYDSQAGMEGRAADLKTLRQADSRPIFSATDFHGSKFRVALRSVESGRYKGVRDMLAGSDGLYDRVKDPRELQNIAASQPRLVREFFNKLRSAGQLVAGKIGSYQVKTKDNAERERLKSLGYLQ